jgi:threonine dehydratase
VATRTPPTVADIEAARRRLDGVARVTPVYGSETFSRLAGREVWLKAENLQRTGAFKIRGAVNKIASLNAEERAAGVVAASAGNHGQAVAWAAREAGIPATVFMPLDAPMSKVDATRNYGARAELVGERFEEALDSARAYVDECGATFLHPFEDSVVIAGQGTIGLELAEQVPQAETVVVPVGGGGLAAGVALALRAHRPEVRIVGVQAGLSGFTIADGVFVKQPGELTMGILDGVLDDLVDVGDEEISEAIVLLLERAKLVVEGAGAVGVAALLGGKVGGDGPVAIVLSGGNIDANMLARVIDQVLVEQGRYLVLHTSVPDRPGNLARLADHLAAAGANVIDINHRRGAWRVPLDRTGLELILEVRDEAHGQEVVRLLTEAGYGLERVGAGLYPT